jgi:hypothetical protein
LRQRGKLYPHDLLSDSTRSATSSSALGLPWRSMPIHPLEIACIAPLDIDTLYDLVDFAHNGELVTSLNEWQP